MRGRMRLAAAIVLSLAVICLAAGVGSVNVSAKTVMYIMGNRLLGLPLREGVEVSLLPVIWDIRLPRVFCAFFVGAALAASGTVMQSVLRNPLASSYTLGVSSGASLGAALVMVTGVSLPAVGVFTLPLAGFVGGLGTVLLAVAFAGRLDHGISNQTIILVGMVLSLFVNAVLTFVSALSRSHMQQLLVWQMGSFSSRRWEHAAIVGCVAAAGILLLCLYVREMDLLTFGEEQAGSAGVEVRAVKMRLIALAALLTGTAVCFTGVIGFVDLIAPHVVRRLFGPAHRLLIPLSALFGGAFMVLADMAARTALAPVELPVGAVTAFIGAPFFAWVYFKNGGRKKTKSGKGGRRG